MHPSCCSRPGKELLPPPLPMVRQCQEVQVWQLMNQASCILQPVMAPKLISDRLLRCMMIDGPDFKRPLRPMSTAFFVWAARQPARLPDNCWSSTTRFVRLEKRCRLSDLLHGNLLGDWTKILMEANTLSVNNSNKNEKDEQQQQQQEWERRATTTTRMRKRRKTTAMKKRNNNAHWFWIADGSIIIDSTNLRKVITGNEFLIINDVTHKFTEISHK